MIKNKRWKKFYHTNTNKNEVVGDVLYQTKISFKVMNIIRDLEKHCIMIIWSINQEYINILI